MVNCTVKTKISILVKSYLLQYTNYMIYLQTFTVAISRPQGATFRVIFELKPYGIRISREYWV